MIASSNGGICKEFSDACRARAVMACTEAGFRKTTKEETARAPKRPFPFLSPETVFPSECTSPDEEQHSATAAERTNRSPPAPDLPHHPPPRLLDTGARAPPRAPPSRSLSAVGPPKMAGSVLRVAMARKPATTDLMSRGGGFAPPHCNSRTASGMSSGTQRARCLVSVSAALASRRRSARSPAAAAAETAARCFAISAASGPAGPFV
jgi:hypothetical protein